MQKKKKKKKKTNKRRRLIKQEKLVFFKRENVIVLREMIGTLNVDVTCPFEQSGDALNRFQQYPSNVAIQYVDVVESIKTFESKCWNM